MDILLIKFATYALIAIALLYTIIFHEISHGFVACKLGDSTSKKLGRLSLNPLRHLSFTGSFLVPVLLLLISNFHFAFGWAKPVRINPDNFKQRWRDMALVGFAGPAVNFCLALISGAVIRIIIWCFPNPSGDFFLIAMPVLVFFTFFNLFLMLVNLMPVPPLDGAHILVSFLPPAVRDKIIAMPALLFMTVFLLWFFFGGGLLLYSGAKFLSHLIIGLAY